MFIQVQNMNCEHTQFTGSGRNRRDTEQLIVNSSNLSCLLSVCQPELPGQSALRHWGTRSWPPHKLSLWSHYRHDTQEPPSGWPVSLLSHPSPPAPPRDSALNPLSESRGSRGRWKRRRWPQAQSGVSPAPSSLLHAPLLWLGGYHTGNNPPPPLSFAPTSSFTSSKMRNVLPLR